ncbi:T9SS type A sorting domain-containing protein [Flavobacterium sp.]|uniref:T9SS type A sorting domain-containing protein n=1 Tax=Flavobacterium sp. TaxID=239 RepID=UPI00375053BD
MKKTLLFYLTFLSFSFANAQWENQNAGFTNKTLGFYEISIVNENTVWAICYDGIGGLFGPTPILDFTRTTNGGTTWTPGTMGNDTSLAFSNISAISATEAWVAMHKFNFSGGGGIFHTIDGGINWTQNNPATLYNNGSFPNFVHFKDALNGITGGDSNDGYFEIYTTTDGGINWTRTPQINIPVPLSGGGFGWFDGYAAVGNTIWFGTNLGQMYKSTDFGLTWTVSTVSPQQEMLYEVAFNDNGLNGICHVRNNTSTKLFSTTNGGASWVQIPTNTIPSWRQSRICSVPGTNVFVSTSVNGGLNGGSAFSNNAGVTWTLIENESQKAACRFLNSSTGWSGGFFTDNPQFGNLDGLFKWDNSVSLNINTNDPNKLDVIIYPNPSKGNLNITFPSEIFSEIKIEVTDMLGRISFKEIYKKSVTNDVVLNLENLSAGNYIIKVVSDSKFVTKKITLTD